MVQITNGAGNRTGAKVSAENRLLTQSVAQTATSASTGKGDSYNINTGLITLTTAGESGVLYVKNNELKDLVVTAVITIFGPSTGGSAADTTRIRFYKNVTTGTLVSNATAVDTISNRNFGSSKTLDADTFKGAEGSTITDGTVHIESLVSPGLRTFFSIDELLTKGDSIVVSYEPNDSNTSMKVMAAIVLHIAGDEE